jgi:hypothetical protein
MKILIQDAVGETFLAPDGSWTAMAATAKDFRFSAYAHLVAKREKLRRLHVVFYFEDLDYFVQARKWKGHREDIMAEALGT